MAYFPLFIDLNQKQGLVVGGGPVAARKIRTLLPYGPHLTVCAPSVLPELETLVWSDPAREPFSPPCWRVLSLCLPPPMTGN